MTFLSDFPDHISPMLVKELRQGLRSKAFVIPFLVFQGLMLFILLTTASAADGDNAGSIISNIILTFFGFAALFFQPLRGNTAINSEIKANTMEVMSLTRLDTTRIVLGKWFSIVSQTALLLVSVIPYLVLRYFFGGMNIFGEMMILGLLFITSTFLTAFTVGLSASKFRIANFVPIVLIFLIFGQLPRYVFSGSSASGFMEIASFEHPDSFLILGGYLLIGSYLAACCLNFGITMIAPPAENHSSVMRFVAIVLTLVISGLAFTDLINPQFYFLLYFLVLAPAFLRALNEPSHLLPPICQPFVKRGILGKLASRILYPGWPAGVYFTVLLSAIALTVLYQRSSNFRDEEFLLASLSLYGAFLFPALLCQYFSKTESKRFLNYLLFLLASGGLTAIALTFFNIWEKKQLYWLFAWNPSMYLGFIDNRAVNEILALKCLVALDALILILMLINATRAFHRYRPVIEATEASLKPPAEA
ncbi:MAG: hypothetical protein QM627_11325 [Luteolibacter sp.]